jgi:hypothetical protein
MSILYKYRGFNRYSLDSVKNNYFYYSKATDFNDVFDSLISYDFSATPCEMLAWAEVNLDSRKYKECLKNPESMMTNEFKDKCKAITDNIRKKCYAFCLSSHYDNKLMWSYYGGANSGFCLGFDTISCGSNSFLDTITPISSCYFPCGKANLFKINYVDYKTCPLMPYNPFKGNSMTLPKALKSKDIVYSHEDEYRSFFSVQDDSIPQKIRYNPESLKEIIFGYAVKDDKKHDLLSRAKKHHDISKIKIYKMELNTSSYELERKLI